MRESFYDDIDAKIEEGHHPLVVLPELQDKYLLAWDNDSGEGYNAAQTFQIPTDGDYILIVGSNITVKSFGAYQLTIGVNAVENELKPPAVTCSYLWLSISRL